MRRAIAKNRVGQMELMKAIRIHNYGGPEALQYEDARSPKPVPGEALIRVHAAGVNSADWKAREGHFKQLVQHKFPLILGWDLSGVIEAVGRGVSKFKKGDEVFSKPATPRDGAYAEYVVVCDPKSREDRFAGEGGLSHDHDVDLVGVDNRPVCDQSRTG